MKVFGITGWSGSGKTTLMVNLLPELIGRGLKVSTMKHTHHRFDLDRKGKDSYEHRQAGASEVLVLPVATSCSKAANSVLRAHAASLALMPVASAKRPSSTP